MTMRDKGGDGSDDDNRVGYGKPPRAHRIAPGEVRNPYGRKGKPKPVDALAQTLAHRTTISIAGELKTVTIEEALHLVTASRALKGNDAAFREISIERRSRRPPGPPPMTLDELAVAEAQAERRRVVSAMLIATLERHAQRKRDKYELDSKPPNRAS